MDDYDETLWDKVKTAGGCAYGLLMFAELIILVSVAGIMLWSASRFPGHWWETPLSFVAGCALYFPAHGIVLALRSRSLPRELREFRTIPVRLIAISIAAYAVAETWSILSAIAIVVGFVATGLTLYRIQHGYFPWNNLQEALSEPYNLENDEDIEN